jgi:hypothetical protein
MHAAREITATDLPAIVIPPAPRLPREWSGTELLAPVAEMPYYFAEPWSGDRPTNLQWAGTYSDRSTKR